MLATYRSTSVPRASSPRIGTMVWMAHAQNVRAPVPCRTPNGADLKLLAAVLHDDAVVVDGLWMDDAAEVEVHW